MNGRESRGAQRIDNVTDNQLNALPDAELLRLARAIAREDFAEPVSRASLTLAKFGHIEAQLESLLGHSKRAAMAIIGAILRERQRNVTSSRAIIAWDGPSPTGHGTRAPYEVLVELIATAEKELLFTGVDLERDARLLRSLHAAQRGRELQATVILAAPLTQPGADAHTSHLERTACVARELFGTFKPWPLLYYPSPDNVRGALPQCLLADRARGLLLAGAPPEVEASEQVLTAGISLEDPTCIAALYAQWQLLIDTGAMLPFNLADAREARE